MSRYWADPVWLSITALKYYKGIVLALVVLATPLHVGPKMGPHEVLLANTSTSLYIPRRTFNNVFVVW